MKPKTYSGRNSSQNEAELRAYIELLNQCNVRRYLEIGARHGDTFHEIMLSLPVGSYGVAVDLPGALWGTNKSSKYLRRAVDDLNGRGYRCSSLFGNSQTLATRTLIVGRGPFDAVLIDGDHTLAGVSRDFALYQDIAELVAFHDIAGTGQAEKVHGNPVEVPLLWERVRHLYPVREFIEPGSNMGIGVLCNSI